MSTSDEDDPNELAGVDGPPTDVKNSPEHVHVENDANKTLTKTNRDRISSVYWQLQNVFAHLKESKLEYYVPDSFWRAFRMWGNEVNVREQQDAFDFFISLTDQIDEHLKKIKREPVFKRVFEGTFSNQFICTECPHKCVNLYFLSTELSLNMRCLRYEREEVFLGLNLPIKSGNLQESLSQFVKDELLDGDNKYNCEQCNEKVTEFKKFLE